jgi:hypothetical protein
MNLVQTSRSLRLFLSMSLSGLMIGVCTKSCGPELLRSTVKFARRALEGGFCLGSTPGSFPRDDRKPPPIARRGLSQSVGGRVSRCQEATTSPITEMAPSLERRSEALPLRSSGYGVRCSGWLERDHSQIAPP